jgi:hypothetical protein
MSACCARPSVNPPHTFSMLSLGTSAVATNIHRYYLSSFQQCSTSGGVVIIVKLLLDNWLQMSFSML